MNNITQIEPSGNRLTCFDTIAALAHASRSAAVVYLALLETAEQRGRVRFFISYKALRRLTGIRDDRTVKAGLNALNAAHWIKRDRRARRGKDGKWIRHQRGFVLKFNRVKIRRHFLTSAKFVGSQFHRTDTASTAKDVGSHTTNEGSQTHRIDSKLCNSTTPQKLGGSSTKKARDTDAAALTAKASSAASPVSAEGTIELSNTIPKALREQIENWIDPSPDHIRVFNRLAFKGGTAHQEEMGDFVDLQVDEAKQNLTRLAGAEECKRYYDRIIADWMNGGDETLVRLYAVALRLWEIAENDFEEPPESGGEIPKPSETIGEIPTEVKGLQNSVNLNANSVCQTSDKQTAIADLLQTSVKCSTVEGAPK